MATTIPLEPPVEPESFLKIFVSFMSIGLIFVAYFFAEQCSAKSAKERSIIKELIIATIGSVFLGIGFLFLLLWARIWI